jgi:DNA polymerase-3 subunit delta
MSEISYKTLKDYLQGLKKDKGTADLASVYLIYGEEMLYKTALEMILDVLIPDGKRNLNYESMTRADENIIDAIERVNTYSLLSRTKVVAICDSRIFYSKQDQGKLIEKSKQALDNKDIKKAANYFIDLLGILNLSFDDVAKENRKKALPLKSDDLIDDNWLDQLIAYCMENSLSIPSVENNADILQRAIDKGFPAGNHLIITTEMVDKRRKLYKTIRKNGMIIDCSVPKGNRRSDRIAQEAVLTERMEQILKPYGKTMGKQAYRAAYEMTGFDLRTFSSNLQKLVSYTGGRTKITVADVEAVLKRTKKDPIYELTNAVSDRNTERSLFFLNALLADNFHPLQILAAITNQVRKLLLAKDFVASSHGSSWRTGIKFEEFKRRTVPAIQKYDRELLDPQEAWDGMMLKTAGGDNQNGDAKKKRKPATDLVIVKSPKNPYPVYQMLLKSEGFTADELVAALECLSQADLRLKSTGQRPKLILEATILRICRN